MNHGKHAQETTWESEGTLDAGRVGPAFLPGRDLGDRLSPGYDTGDRCDSDKGTARLGVATTTRWSGTVTLLLDEQALFASAATIAPDAPFRADVPLPASITPNGKLTLRCVDGAGNVVAEFTQGSYQ
ncbi:MAG TPA: hypothetical protein EYH32_10435 [Anaerolineae bacterium]|nr:hypothetical protein [Anaerolineae bacterium]